MYLRVSGVLRPWAGGPRCQAGGALAWGWHVGLGFPALDSPPSPVRQQVQGEGPRGQDKSSSRCAAGSATGMFVPLGPSSPCSRGGGPRGLHQGLVGDEAGTRQREGRGVGEEHGSLSLLDIPVLGSPTCEVTPGEKGPHPGLAPHPPHPPCPPTAAASAPGLRTRCPSGGTAAASPFVGRLRVLSALLVFLEKL